MAILTITKEDSLSSNAHKVFDLSAPVSILVSPPLATACFNSPYVLTISMRVSI